MRAIIAQLTADPISPGDPVRELAHAGLLEMHLLKGHLLARYAVDEANRIVYVKEFKPVLGHPLAEP